MSERVLPLAGLAVSLLLYPALLLALRGLATATRRLSADWCAVPSMTLDAADQMLGDNPAAARALLAEARESSAKALAELRALRGCD